MISVSKIFEILPGHGLELCNMSISQQGIPFVNRSSKNNGVACRIDPIDDLLPLPAHTLSVALNGSTRNIFADRTLLHGISCGVFKTVNRIIRSRIIVLCSLYKIKSI